MTLESDLELKYGKGRPEDAMLSHIFKLNNRIMRANLTLDSLVAKGAPEWVVDEVAFALNTDAPLIELTLAEPPC